MALGRHILRNETWDVLLITSTLMTRGKFYHMMSQIKDVVLYLYLVFVTERDFPARVMRLVTTTRSSNTFFVSCSISYCNRMHMFISTGAASGHHHQVLVYLLSVMIHVLLQQIAYVYKYWSCVRSPPPGPCTLSFSGDPCRSHKESCTACSHNILFYKNLPFLKILPWDIEEMYTWSCLQSTPKLLSLKKGTNYEKAGNFVAKKYDTGLRLLLTCLH
jgi:hypothetical protein